MTPIPGRPNWFRDANGNERYIEPKAAEPIVHKAPDGKIS